MDEQNFLASVLGNKGSWCGLNKQNGVFEWISGEQSNFTYWAAKEPKQRKRRLCVHVSYRKSHKWRMANCAKKRRYTCEKGLLNSNIYTLDRPTVLNLFIRTVVGDSMLMSPEYYPSGYHAKQWGSLNIIGGRYVLS